MRITELFTAQSIALNVAAPDQAAIIDKLVDLQATHGNITDKDAYKKALYAREAEASTYVDNGITVPHARTACVTRPSLAALRLSEPVQYNADDDGKTDLLFAIAAPENGSLHIDMLARMMQMLMNEDFVEKLRAAKTPAAFLDAIDAQEDAQFGEESFTEQEIPQNGYRVLAVTACPNGIAHTYMAAEALTKTGDKLGLPTKVETNGSDGAKNILTAEEIAACDGIIIAADKNVETARFDGKPVLFARVDDGIHKPEELIKKIAHGEAPIFHARGGAAQSQSVGGAGDTVAHSLYKHLMNGVSHMLPFVVGGGIMIALAFLLDDYSINPLMGIINTAMSDWLNALGGSSKILLGAIVAGMMSVDMGGPFNKAAYVFGTAALASGNYEVMAAVMVGGMVPPIAIALSTTFCPKKWSPDERRNGIVNYVMGLCFVSEGAIPYAAADPLRVLPSCIIGSALSGALSMVFGCALRAPHGGIFVFPVVDHALLYVVALAAGSAVGAVILSLLKKDYTAE